MGVPEKFVDRETKVPSSRIVSQPIKFPEMVLGLNPRKSAAKGYSGPSLRRVAWRSTRLRALIVALFTSRKVLLQQFPVEHVVGDGVPGVVNADEEQQ